MPPDSPMTVHCPHCSTGYLLPDALLGTRGARVRCPNCGKAFVVLREGRALAEVSAPSMPHPAPANGEESRATGVSQRMTASKTNNDRSAPAGESEAAVVAGRLLDELSARLGEPLERARIDRRVLSQFGADIMRTYEEYRRTLGERGSPDAFRVALRERLAVDLMPGS